MTCDTNKGFLILPPNIFSEAESHELKYYVSDESFRQTQDSFQVYRVTETFFAFFWGW